MPRALALLCCALLYSTFSQAADLYWVATSASNWNAAANWASSSGGAGGAGVPGASDVAHFDAAATADCALDVPIDVTAIDVQTGYTGTLTQGAGATIELAGDFTLADGAFVGGSDDITLFPGQLLITGGSFTSTTGRLDLFNALTISGAGSFAHNGGQTRIVPPTAGFTFTGNVTFHDFIIRRIANGTAPITIGTTNQLIIENDMSYDGNGRTTLNGGDIHARGNITLTGSSLGGTATFRIDGTGNQTITGHNDNTIGGIGNAVIDKASGALTIVNSTLFFHSITYVQGTLNDTDPNASWVFFVPGNQVFTFNGNVALDKVILSHGSTNTQNFIVTLGDVLTVNTKLTYLSIGGIRLTDGDIHLKGDLVLGTSCRGGTGTLTMNGTGDQLYDRQISASNSVGYPSNLVIDKPSGNLVLVDRMLIRQSFTHLQGDIDYTTNNAPVYFVGSVPNISGQFEVGEVHFNSESTTRIFTVADGTVIDVKGTYFLESGNPRVLGLLAQINAYGDITHTSVSGTTDGNIQLHIVGDGTQTITGSGFQDRGRLNNVTLNKPTGDVVLSGIQPFNNAFTFVNGRIISTATDLCVFYTGSSFTNVTGMSDASHVDGPVLNYGNQGFNYPIGKNGQYRPLFLSAPGGGTEQFRAEYFDQGQAFGNTLDPTLNGISSCEYWTLDHPNGSSLEQVTLGWDPTSCDAPTNLNDIRLARWDGTTWKDDLGQGTVTGTLTDGTVQTGIPTATFGPLVLANVITPDVTQLQSGDCGATNVTLDQILRADAKTGATEYTFEVSQGGNVVETIVRTNRKFKFEHLTNPALFNTTYDIRVAWTDGVTNYAFGPSCPVTTGAHPLTQLQAVDCGITVTTLDQIVHADAVPVASEYHFRVIGGGINETVIRPNRKFKFEHLSTPALFNTTYTIEVLTVVGGSTSAFGPVCNVTIGSHPLTQLQVGDCGAIDVAPDQILRADQVAGATEYLFRVTGNGISETITRPNRKFRFEHLTATVQYNTTYQIEAASLVGGSTSAFGSVCDVTVGDIVTPQLSSQDCGAIDVPDNQNLKSEVGYAATAYEFEVRNDLLGFVETIVSTDRNFKLNELTGTLQEGVAYDVRVRIQVGPLTGQYGPVCSIVTLRSTGSDIYAPMLKVLDGGYHTSYDGILRFRYDEEYNDQDQGLQYNIYNVAHNVVADETDAAVTVVYGDNRREIDIRPSGVCLPKGYYVLEITNEKNEKFLLRFFQNFNAICEGGQTDPGDRN